MSKVCDWYRDNSCDCFCDGLNANCEKYSGDLLPDTESESIKGDTSEETN